MRRVEGAQAKPRQSLIRLAAGALCLDRNRLVAVINHAAKMAGLRGRTDPERSGKCVMVSGARYANEPLDWSPALPGSCDRCELF